MVATLKKHLFFNSLPNDKILDWSKLKQIADDISSIDQLLTAELAYFFLNHQQICSIPTMFRLSGTHPHHLSCIQFVIWEFFQYGLKLLIFLSGFKRIKNFKYNSRIMYDEKQCTYWTFSEPPGEGRMHRPLSQGKSANISGFCEIYDDDTTFICRPSNVCKWSENLQNYRLSHTKKKKWIEHSLALDKGCCSVHCHQPSAHENSVAHADVAYND